MYSIRRTATVLAGCATLLVGSLLVGDAAAAAPSDSPAGKVADAAATTTLRSLGTGKASFYGRRFSGHRMAGGGRFDPNAAVAAHRTLPFGTQLRVTNMRNGKSAIVTVRDRGPYVRGRLLDVSRSTAERLGMTAQGVAQVKVDVVEVAQAPD